MGFRSPIKLSGVPERAGHRPPLAVDADRNAILSLKYIGPIAKRATALGGTALGTVRMPARDSRLPEYSFDAVESC